MKDNINLLPLEADDSNLKGSSTTISPRALTEAMRENIRSYAKSYPGKTQVQIGRKFDLA